MSTTSRPVAALRGHRPAVRVVAWSAGLALLGGGLYAATSATADGEERRSPQDLLDAVRASVHTPVTGTVTWDADLGVLDAGAQQMGLPADGTTLGVTSDGRGEVRLDLPGGDEGDVVLTASDLGGSTPQDLVALLLRDPADGSELKTDGSGRVAGRDTSTLVVRPQDPATRIAEVRLAVDDATGVPLHVEVVSEVTGREALDVAFTEVEFPAGERPADAATAADPAPSGAPDEDAVDPDFPLPPGPQVIGEGASAVLVTRLVPIPAPGPGTEGAQVPEITGVPQGPTDPAEAVDRAQASDASVRLTPADLDALLARLPQRQSAAGPVHVLDGPLIGVVVTPDGRAAVGATDTDTLVDALVRAAPGAAR